RALGSGGPADRDRDPLADGAGPRGTVGAHRRDDQRARCLCGRALRPERRPPHRFPDPQHAGRPGLGKRRAERRRCDPGAEQAERRVRTARPDAARADRRDRRARARTHPHRQLMPEERRNAGGDRRRQPRRKTERKVTTGSKLDLILDVTRRLMSITDLDALLRDMATVTTQLLDADRATIFIVDRDRAEIWSKIALGTGAGEIRQAIGVGIAGTVAATGETINIADAYEDPRFNPEPDHRTGYRTKTLLTFPMTGQNGRVIGVFQVVNKNGGGEFTADDEETLSSLGASAAVAVENAQLVAEQRRLWTTLIETLAVTIDARDQQTAGHSQRVTRYAEVIGRALGL